MVIIVHYYMINTALSTRKKQLFVFWEAQGLINITIASIGAKDWASIINMARDDKTW